MKIERAGLGLVLLLCLGFPWLGEAEELESHPAKETELFWKLAQEFHFTPATVRTSPNGSVLFWGKIDASLPFTQSIREGAVGITTSGFFIDRSGELFDAESSVRFIHQQLLDDLGLQDATVEFFGAIASVTGVGLAARFGWAAVVRSAAVETATWALPPVGYLRMMRPAGVRFYRNLKLDEDLKSGMFTFRSTIVLNRRSGSKLADGAYNFVHEFTARGFELRVGPTSVRHSELATSVGSEFVAAPGELRFTNGKVNVLANSSGHYWPEPECLEIVKRHLDAEGLSASHILVKNYPGIEAMQRTAEQLKIQNKIAVQSSTTAH